MEGDQPMEMDDKARPPGGLQPGEVRNTAVAETSREQEESTATRRHFLGRSAGKLAYIAPLVLLIRPRPACASRIYSGV